MKTMVISILILTAFLSFVYRSHSRKDIPTMNLNDDENVRRAINYFKDMID